MPRRPPPSALLLHPGPTPPREQPKHRLPTMPRPTFYPNKAAPLPAHASTRPPAPALDINIPMPDTMSSAPSSPQSRAKSPLRGPWDHSRSLSESSFDVDSFIRLPQPAAVTVSPLSSSVW